MFTSVICFKFLFFFYWRGKTKDYLTITPAACKGYGSIAHEVKPNGLLNKRIRMWLQTSQTLNKQQLAWTLLLESPFQWVLIKSGTVNPGYLPARSLTQYEPGVLVLLCKKDFSDHDPSVEITKVAVNSYIYIYGVQQSGKKRGELM